MNSNNVIEFKRVENPEPLVDADYFGSEKIPVHDLLSLLDFLKQNKNENDK
jgi:hypothetical protein